MQTSLTLKESIQQTDYRECQMDNKSYIFSVYKIVDNTEQPIKAR